MRLNNLLAQGKTAIVKKWFVSAIETYPSDAVELSPIDGARLPSPHHLI
jgi:hypothetical protein